MSKSFIELGLELEVTDAEVDYEEQIINKLIGKADCANNKLLSSGVSNFHNMISDLKTLGLKIYAYTVNSEEQLEKVKYLNIHGIFTDDPTNYK